MSENSPITTSETIIAFLLREAEKDEIDDFTQLKIIKLVFLCHGYTLGFHGKPLIENRYKNIQAWKHGPVVIDVYHALKRFKRDPITLNDFYSSLSKVPFWNTRDVAEKKLDDLEKNEEVYNLLVRIYNHFKVWSANNLIELTHLDNTPWDLSYVEGKRDRWIIDKLIKSYYKSDESVNV